MLDFAHRLATFAFLAASLYSLLVIWSLLGGPVSPDTLIPFPARANVAATGPVGSE